MVLASWTLILAAEAFDPILKIAEGYQISTSDFKRFTFSRI
jgi:hypothetical protein